MVQRTENLTGWGAIELFSNNTEILKMKLVTYHGNDSEISRKFYKISIKVELF